jgi:predicted Zn-dependent protease
MKKVLGLGLVLAATLLSSDLVQAEVLTHPGAKVQINVPAKWTQKQDGDSLLITSPDGGVAIVFVVIASKDVDAAFAAMDKELEKSTGGVEWANDGEATEETINGMPAAEWNGTAQDGEVYVDVLAIDTPAEKDLGIYWFTAAAAEKKNQADINTIVKGLKPIK